MTIHRMASAEFGENPERARQVAEDGPVFIAEAGRSTHVLLAMEEYEKLKGQQSFLESIAHWDGGDFDFDPPKLSFGLRPAEFD